VRSKTYKLALLCILSFQLSAQTGTKLVGAHSNGTLNVFSSIDVTGGNYNLISGLATTSNLSVQETTFDEFNSRYFVKSGSRILILNALNGNLLDSIPNVTSFYNMEYDRRSNSLVGMNRVGKTISFMAYNLAIKTGSTMSILAGVDSLVIGESTYDQRRRKYFAMTNLGMAVVDSTGTLSDVLCASPNLSGIEYDAASNRVYYLEWNSSSHFFVGVEANTCNIGVLGTFTAVTAVSKGESTFNQALSHYFCRTNLGLIEADIQNGSLLQTLTATNNFRGMEFFDASTTAIGEENIQTGTRVYPNPGKDVFNFSELKKGADLEVFDLSGTCIFQTEVSETSFRLILNKPSGMYFYRISNEGEVLQQGKLILIE
jgi:hypothetical protein